MYISCMKLNGFPILPPIISPEYRKELLIYKQQAILVEKRLIEAIASENKTSIEQSLAFNESSETSKDGVNRVPYTNLTCDIQVSQYTNNEFKVIYSDKKSLISSDTEESLENPDDVSIRRNSYTLDSPSPFLIEKLANNVIETSFIQEDAINKLSAAQSSFVERFAKIEINDTANYKTQASINQIEEIESDIMSPNNLINLSSDTETELMNMSLDSSIESHIHFQSPNIDKPNNELYKILTDIPKDYSDKLLSLFRRHEDNYSTTTENRERWAADVIVAWARGHLVRRLLRSAHVQRLIDTIRAALICAVELHGETEDRIQAADVELHRRLIQQVSAACCDFHDVFFQLSTVERMHIIHMDRIAKLKQLEQAKKGSKGGERPLTAHGRVMALASRRRQTTPTANRRLFPPLSTVIQSN